MPGKAGGPVPSQETSPPSLDRHPRGRAWFAFAPPARTVGRASPRLERRRGQVKSFVLAVAILAPTGALDAQVAATVRVTVRAAASAPPVAGGGEEGGVSVAATTPAHAGALPATVALAGATVTVRTAGLSVVTGPGGAAVLRGLAPGRHALLISALGFAEATLEVEAVNGRVTRAAVVLAPSPVRLAGLDVRAASRAGGSGATVVETAGLPPGVGDLPAALERVPGVTVVRQGGAGAPAVVQLRGSGGDQVLVILDGTPINSPLTGVADLSTVDIESVARIVVIPGAQSARYGPRALGGVVLLESRAAGGAAGAVTAGAGAWSSAETAVTGSRSVGDAWSVSGGGRWRRSEGAFTYDVPAFRGGGETTRENAGFSHVGGDLRLARSGPLRPSVRAHLSDIERGSPGTIAQPSLSGIQHHRRWGVAAQIEPGGPGLGATARTSVQWQRAEYADPAPPFGPAYDTRTRVRRAELALEGWWRRGTPSLRLGLDAARLDVESNILATPALDLGELGAWARAVHGWELGRGRDRRRDPGRRSAPGDDTPADRVTGSNSVDDPGRPPHLDLGASIRADRHDLVDGVAISPALDATLTRAGLTLDLRWGRGFSPPGLGDLFFQEGFLVEPNPDLRPERIHGELSATAAQAGSLGPFAGQLHGTVYRADLDDMILWFPDHRFVWSPDNYDVRRRGLELGANADLDVLGATHSLAANAAGSEVEYTGDVLAGQVASRPRFTADISLNLELPGGITLSPAAAHVGERRAVPGSELNALGAYTLFDAGIAIPLTLGRIPARLDLALTNLFDERAALLVDYPLPGRGWSTRFRMGAGR